MKQRSVIYAGTLLTGMTGLIYQVVWQKYLTFVVGSESRSVALVVAAFLTGLAAGYRYWGKLSERKRSRRRLLRTYGVIELGIGLYAAMFPLYVGLVRYICYHLPAWFVTDMLAAALTILAPTFLMGATIPLLVSVVPESADEVHLCHARIYGINTLGACVGAFASSFLLLPRLGLPATLLLGGLINVIVGVVFIANRLPGSTTEKQTIESIPNHFGIRTLYLYTLVTGTITLSLEVLFVRMLNLTIGPGPHNFAIVVGIFILGLALGSLALTPRLLSVRVLFGAIGFLTLYLIGLYYTVPYWAVWISNLRVMLTDLPVNYSFFMLLVTVLLALLMLPFLIPLGFMLPLVYGLLPKDTRDYGKTCGRLYFYNTVGTALGAIVLSHLLLFVVDLDTVFKINVALLASLSSYLFVRERRRATGVAIAVVALAFVAGPGWDRSAHYSGLYRSSSVQPYNFQGVFALPVYPAEVLFFEDGPDATVTVSQYEAQTAYGSTVVGRGLTINGKGDGDTVEDYSTITLAAILPYIYGPDRSDLKAAVVGLGTGITAGVLAGAEDVDAVTVAEISSSLVGALPEFDQDNFGLSTSEKVNVRALDGFKYFTRLRGELDIVVSATSPPWVVGVENLFTPEFYRLAHQALADDGVFLQWFPLYTMDATLFRTIVKNLQQEFPYQRLFVLSNTEMGILAAKSPVFDGPDVRRFEEPFIRQVASRMHVERLEQLSLITLYDTDELRFLSREPGTLTHTMSRPSLSYASDRIRFYKRVATWDEFIDPRLRRTAGFSEQRKQALIKLLELYPRGLPCSRQEGQMHCDFFTMLARTYATYAHRSGSVDLLAMLGAYDTLRQQGLESANPQFLTRISNTVVTAMAPGSAASRDVINQIVLNYVKDGLWDDAMRDLETFVDRGFIDRAYRDQMVAEIDRGRAGHAEFVERLGQT